MALSATEYQDLFEGIGRLVKAMNQFRDMAGSYNSPVPDLVELLTNASTGIAPKFAEIGRYDALDGIVGEFERYRDEASRWAESLANWSDVLINDSEVIHPKLPGLPPNPSIQDVLAELIRDMNREAEYLAASTVLAAVSGTESGNNGNGTVLLTKFLDGVSNPSPGFAAHEDYNDVGSQLSVTETMTLECVSDSSSNNRPEGEEVWRLKGQPSSGFTFGWRPEGSGVDMSLRTLNSEQIISNKDFENWSSAGAPLSWILDSGTAATHVIKETDAAQIYRGDAALKLVGNGSLASIQLSQPVRQGQIRPNRMYVLSCFVKGNASLAQGSLTIQFESPSGAYTAGSTTTGGVNEQIVMNAAALQAQTSYGIEHFFFIAPPVIPDDLELVIKLTGTPTNAQPIRIDSLAFGPVTYANGVGFAVVAGSNRWLRGDRVYVAVNNNNAGIFQDFFKRQYRIQLPTDASPTIANSLAT